MCIAFEFKDVKQTNFYYSGLLLYLVGIIDKNSSYFAPTSLFLRGQAPAHNLLINGSPTGSRGPTPTKTGLLTSSITKKPKQTHEVVHKKQLNQKIIWVMENKNTPITLISVEDKTVLVLFLSLPLSLLSSFLLFHYFGKISFLFT